MKTIISFLCLSILMSCNNDNEIIRLLSSKEKDDIILGSRKAGNTKNKKFVPFLLKNAEDWRRSTNLNFKGISVYQARMEALRDIFEKQPPMEISMRPDSVVIRFYTDLFLETEKK